MDCSKLDTGDDGTRPFGPRAGFSLTEVMVAVFVFSIGMIGVYGLMTSVIRMNRFLDDMRSAIVVAEHSLEDLAVSNLVAGSAGAVTGARYTVSWYTGGALTSGARVVKVAASWKDVQGNAQTIDLRSIVIE